MKQYSAKILLFLLPIFVILLSLEVLLRNIPNDYKFKRDYLNQYAPEIKTLILGNSHTFLGLRPDYFDGHTFNSANNGQTLKYDYAIFEKYKSEFKNLETIIIPISYPTLWIRFETTEGGDFLKKNYEMYSDINNSRKLPFYLEVIERSFDYNVKKAYGYYIQDDNYKLSQKFGWGKREALEKPPVFSEFAIKQGKKYKKEAEKYNFSNIDSNINKSLFKESVDRLNSIIDWGRQNNVNIILLTTPTHLYYRETLNPKQLEKTIKAATELASNNKNCMYLNLLSDQRFTDEDFRDAHHLNPRGAAKLSKIVNQKIKEFE